MALQSNDINDLNRKRIIESSDVPGQPGIVVLNPDGTAVGTPVGGATSANQTNGTQKTQIVDGSGNVIGSTSNALDVNIKSGSSETQYTEGDTDASITGTAVMWEDTSDTLRAVSHAKPLPVHVTTVENGVVSTVNSSTATLTANSTFTGTSEEVLDVSMIIVNVKASHASATDGLAIDFSPDGTNWDNSDKYTIPAATGKTFTAQPAGKYMRVRYTNGGTNQTYFRLETILKYVSTKPSSHRVQDTLSDDDDGELGISVIKLRTAQDNYVSGAATAGGNFKVSLEETNGYEPTQYEGGEVTVGTSAVEVTFTAQTKSILIQADHSNTGNIWIGKSNVTSSANRMARLMAGESVTLTLNDATDPIYAISDTASQKIYKLAITQ